MNGMLIDEAEVIQTIHRSDYADGDLFEAIAFRSRVVRCKDCPLAAPLADRLYCMRRPGKLEEVPPWGFCHVGAAGTGCTPPAYVRCADCAYCEEVPCAGGGLAFRLRPETGRLAVCADDFCSRGIPKEEKR